jgi:hypothetical protein
MLTRIVLALTLAATILTAAATRTASAKTHEPKVKGYLRVSTCSFLCIGHDDLVDHIHGTDVWCAWKGDHVHVHIMFSSTSDHDVEATIRPTYRTIDGGRHGSSLFSLKSVKLGSNSRREWLGDAGRPHNTRIGTAISLCEPTLSGVSRRS